MTASRRWNLLASWAGCDGSGPMFAAVVLAALIPTRVHVAPTIDGSLDDWRDIPSTDAFTQSFPTDGVKPSEHTLLRVAYDDTNIYIAVDCEQHAEQIVRLTRHRARSSQRVSLRG